jgi:S-disulfanyl-L-cysteine oxidoreductase SoxD
MQLAFAALALFVWTAHPQTQIKTVLDGVYSEGQATHGKALYTSLCASCHGSSLEGVSAPDLAGNRFVGRWREGTLDNLYNFIKQRMPLGRSANAARIPDNDYLDIVTYILRFSEYPAGSTDLTPGVLENVMFVGKNGPQPVPDGALVITVGCLSQTDSGSWVLMSATEPSRTRFEKSTPEEARTSSQKNLGALTFRLADLDAAPDFMPEMHKGHKIQAKGYLVRQPNAERINVSSVEVVASSCMP